MSASFKETRVTFGTQESQHLAGILTEPVDAPNSTVEEASGSNKPLYAQHCGIMCHGFASHKNGFHFPAIAAHLATQIGMSSLRFDYAGNMDSSGDFRFGGFMKVSSHGLCSGTIIVTEHLVAELFVRLCNLMKSCSLLCRFCIVYMLYAMHEWQSMQSVLGLGLALLLHHMPHQPGPACVPNCSIYLKISNQTPMDERSYPRQYTQSICFCVCYDLVQPASSRVPLH